MRHVVTLVASICRLASFCCDRDGLPLGCEPPGSGGPAARVAEVLVAAVASGADLAADLAVGEGRRVHVRIRDSGLDRLLEGCEITGLEPLRGRPMTSAGTIVPETVPDVVGGQAGLLPPPQKNTDTPPSTPGWPT
jgi:hypothetical protein